MLIERNYKIIMWDILSADFDNSITGEECVQNVVFKLQPGAIVVFHDSEKAWDRMSYTLPRILEHCARKGLRVEAIV